jgi:hypothetical protein
MGRERRPVNQLKKSLRKLSNDAKVPPRIRMVGVLCLAKIDKLLDNDFIALLGLTKQVMNPDKAIEDKTVEPVEPDTDMDALLNKMKEPNA